MEVNGRKENVVMSLSPPSQAILAYFLLFLVGCGAPPPSRPAMHHATPTVAVGQASEAPPVVEHLLRLMRDRLALMHDVARSKWNANRSVGDPERERALLHEMEEKGKEYGLDPQFTRAFFAAQIAAARRVQQADFARWRAEGHSRFDDAPDLAALRQRIDGLNRELLGTLAKVRPQVDNAGTREQLGVLAREVLSGEGITDDVRAAAVEGLAHPQQATLLANCARHGSKYGGHGRGSAGLIAVLLLRGDSKPVSVGLFSPVFRWLLVS